MQICCAVWPTAATTSWEKPSKREALTYCRRWHDCNTAFVGQRSAVVAVATTVAADGGDGGGEGGHLLGFFLLGFFVSVGGGGLGGGIHGGGGLGGGIHGGGGLGGGIIGGSGGERDVAVGVALHGAGPGICVGVGVGVGVGMVVGAMGTGDGRGAPHALVSGDTCRSPILGSPPVISPSTLAFRPYMKARYSSALWRFFSSASTWRVSDAS